MATKRRLSSCKKLKSCQGSIAKYAAQMSRSRRYRKASGLVQRRNELKKQNSELEETKKKINEMSQAIASGFTDAIRSVINGTKSVDEAFSDMLASIGQSFVDMALKVIEQQLVMIANGLLMKALGISMPGASSGPMPGAFDIGQAFSGRANGGPVSGGTPYIVGEEGQEVFIPGMSGMIVPMTSSKPLKQHLSMKVKLFPLRTTRQRLKQRWHLIAAASQLPTTPPITLRLRQQHWQRIVRASQHLQQQQQLDWRGIWYIRKQQRNLQCNQHRKQQRNLYRNQHRH